MSDEEIPAGADWTKQLCACGQPLHYTDFLSGAAVQTLCDVMGPTMRVSIPDGRSWAVPRHYIALHGIKSATLAEDAANYGFEEVTGRDDEED